MEKQEKTPTIDSEIDDSVPKITDDTVKETVTASTENKDAPEVITDQENEKKNADDVFKFEKPYIVLATQLMWNIPEERFSLSHLRDNGWFVKVSDIPERVIPAIRKAMEFGILVNVSDPRKWQTEAQAAVESLKAEGFKDARPRLKNTEFDKPRVLANREVPRNPSIAGKTLSTDKAGEAFRALNSTPDTAKCIKVIQRISAGMNDSKAEMFLKETLQLEQRGFNLTYDRRGTVVDAVNELMADRGFANSVGDVNTEPIVTDKTPLQPLG